MNNSSDISSAKVSAIIPMYNAAPYIEEAIESILKQTYPVSEIIVVDDGSTDGGAEIVSRYEGVRLIKKVHSGIRDTLNEGLAAAQFSFLGFLDADDRWTPSKTAIQLRILLDDEAIDIVFGHAERFQMIKDSQGINEKKIDILPGVGMQGGFFRKSVFEKVGGFSTDPQSHSFMEWFARAKDANMKIHIHPDIVFERRIHESNTSIINKDEQRKSYFNTLKAVMERRRGQFNG